MKHCYVRFYEDLHVLFDDRFIEVTLFNYDTGELTCHLNGVDNWECSYTAPDAEDKFNALLSLGEVTWDDIERLGFKQYG